MPKKSFIFCLVLCVSYFVLCNILDKNYPGISADQSIWSRNIIKAQKFIFNNQEHKYNCLLGSSLSGVLVADSLPENLVVLGLNGQGVLDGLNLIEVNSVYPDTLYVEINVLQRDLNKSFYEYFNTSKEGLKLKKNLLFLHERFIPIGLAGTGIETLLKSSVKKSKKRDTPIVNESLLNIQLGLQKNYHSRILSKSEEEIMYKAIDKLKSFEKKSVKIIFFEMPVHCSLVNMPLSVSIRNIISGSFPESKYRYIDNGGCENYQTTDGLHLSEPSAEKYSSYLRNQILN